MAHSTSPLYFIHICSKFIFYFSEDDKIMGTFVPPQTNKRPKKKDESFIEEDHEHDDDDKDYYDDDEREKSDTPKIPQVSNKGKKPVHQVSAKSSEYFYLFHNELVCKEISRLLIKILIHCSFPALIQI
jgi:hypothetical protein